jgi:hypothetical protein
VTEPGITLYWLRSERTSVRQADDHRAGPLAVLQKVAMSEGVSLVPVTPDDITATDFHGEVSIRVLGQQLDRRNTLFHTTIPGDPAGTNDAWRQLTTTGIVEAAGFCVTVPSLHSILLGDRLAFLLKHATEEIPAVPTVRVCTREIEVHERDRFQLEQWGLELPVVITPDHGESPGPFVVEGQRKLSSLLQLIGASEATVLVQPWFGDDAQVHRVLCVDGEPLGNGAPTPVTAPARRIAQQIGLPFIQIDFLESAGKYWLHDVDIDGCLGGPVDETANVQISAYRDHFTRFLERDGNLRKWAYR